MKLYTAILILYSSCNMSDTTIPIFGDYVYDIESKTNRSIMGGSNIIPYDVVAYDYDKKFLIAKQKPNIDVLIYQKANDIYIQYENDDLSGNDSITFLLKKHGAKSNFSGEGNFDANAKASNEVAKILLIDDEMFKKYQNNKYLYWILIRKSDKLIGPLSDAEFMSKKMEFDISDKLKFKE